MVFQLEILNFNYSLIGILYATRFILRSVMEIPSGIVADALGRRNSLVFSYVLYIISFISYYLSNNFLILLAASAIFGLADAFRTGTHKAMIIDYLSLKKWESHKTRYYGLTRSWSQMGSSISSIIVFAIFLATNNYRTIFAITIIPYLLGVLNLITYPNFLNRRLINRKHSIYISIKHQCIESFKLIWSYNNIKTLSFSSMYFGYYQAIKDYIQPVILGLGLTLPFILTTNNTETSEALIIPLFYSFIFLISVIASRYAYRAKLIFKTDRNVVGKLTLTGSIAGILFASAHYFNFNLISIIPFIGVFAILNFQRPSAISFISSRFSHKNMATVLSIESQIGSIIAAILSLTIGFLSEALNLGIAIGIASVGLILLTVLISFRTNEDNN